VDLASARRLCAVEETATLTSGPRWPFEGHQSNHTGSSNRTAARAIMRPLGRRFAFGVLFAIGVAKLPKHCHLFERGRIPKY
jgi:hypothetical protein